MGHIIDFSDLLEVWLSSSLEFDLQGDEFVSIDFF